MHTDVDDDLPPDADDFDTVDVPDPEALELDPRGVDGDDRQVRDREPEAPAERDAPIEEGPAARGPLILARAAGESADDDAIARRWRRRLRTRERLLAAAREARQSATTPAEIAVADARVAKREQQVAYARRVLARHNTTVVERVVRAAMLAYQHRAVIFYTQDSRAELAAQGGVPRRWDGIKRGLRSKNGQVPRYADCSSFVTWCYWDALGGPNAGPDIINGGGWASGYTGTQIDHGREVPIAAARTGDLAFYVRDGEIGHVTVVVAPGRVVSHGDGSGPKLLALDYDGKLRSVRRYVA